MAASPTTCVSAAWDCSRPAVLLLKIDGWPFGSGFLTWPDLLTGDPVGSDAACGAGRLQPENMIC
jgi:hypothetical protein